MNTQTSVAPSDKQKKATSCTIPALEGTLSEGLTCSKNHLSPATYLVFLLPVTWLIFFLATGVTVCVCVFFPVVFYVALCTRR